MRVLVNALQANNRSGTGVYLVQLARRLPALAGDDALIFAWPKGYPVPEQGQRPNASFVERGFAGPAARLRYDQFGIRRDISDFGADVVHYPANVGSVFPLKNMVVTIHDMTFFLEPSWYRYERAQYYRWAVSQSAKRAARIIAVSQSTANDIHEVLRIPYERIVVVNQGADERFRPAPQEAQNAVRDRYRLPRRYILYYGTIEPRKNLARLIHAWERIARGCEPDLVLAGRLGWKTEAIEDVARRTPLTKRIHFPGFIEEDDLPALISAADVVALPSLYEGFGNAIQEGMACGVPVLTSNVSSMPEVAGGAALLVDPHDVDAIAEGLKRLIEDERLRGELIEKGFERARQLTWSKTAEGALRVYRSVAA